MNTRLIDGSEFIHLPKTGGTWVSTILQSQRLSRDLRIGRHEHANYDMVFLDAWQRWRAARFRKLKNSVRKRITPNAPDPAIAIADKLDNTFRFCFVRHPLTWYESIWKYRRQNGCKNYRQPKTAGGWHSMAVLSDFGSEDFNQFVRNVMAARPGFVSELYFSYARPGISFVGRMESLSDDLVRVLTHLGLDFDESALRGLGHQNRSRSASKPIEWDPEVRATAMRLELPALTHYGYIDDEARELAGLPDSFQVPPSPALTSIP
ncbi:MAG: hypothetical protein AAF750_09760 [Planctomycetota bacterium]